MNVNPRAQKIQQMRRCVLAILLEAYGVVALEGETVFELLLERYPDASEGDLQKDLTYLMEADKGYVETVGQTRGVAWDKRRYGLTGKGNDVANQLEHDPALGI